ncbi:hypothetical protein EF912_32270 [Streptomyces sp. WAC07061]|uniref:hypothetical protein n=1 Tax=Streptomyces sp. WAC07061 TaxID=2487410 RepID=UPI000F7AD3EB|nr:hypothetical protein [Streptomyces sp. WAC07061]RSS40440.1 hypothetical protein EF912_32270 [Streptomyces sp. WAC07061]
MTDREFKLMAKDSGTHFDKCYRIHGYVTQADSSTGTLTVRANTCGEKHEPKYGYIADCDTNSMLFDFGTAKGEGLKAIVDGDAFEADVIVGKPYSYQTTLGGQLTVPSFFLIRIERYASVK